MLNRLISVLACLIVAGAVLAQTTQPVARRAVLGKATKVQGLVTVSDDAGVIRVLVNNAVIDHSRYVTSSSGSATLHMDKGCDIELKPNQALTVEDEKSCEALWASIESLGDPAGGILFAGGGGGGAAAGGVVAAGSGSSLLPFVAGGVAILLMGGGGGGGSTDPGGGIDIPDIPPNNCPPNCPVTPE